MDSVATDYPDKLVEAREPPCLSLYQPTSRRHPENLQDPIRFRNLVRTMERSLQETYPAEDVQSLLKPFLALADDRDFWNTTHDGLAVLGAAGFFRVYRLERPVDELAIVADSFHTKPLMRIVQSADRYQVLGLDLQSIRLFEGSRDGLAEVDLASGVPRTITAALGEELTEPHQTVASYGMGARGLAMHHGHGAKKDEVGIDAERFFRAVDRAVLEHHSRPARLPLLLAGLPEHHARFRRVSRNPFLMEAGLEVHPDALELDALRERAWRVVEPKYRARLAELVERFGAAMSKGLGADDPAQVAKAAVAGQIATVLIDADRQLPGRIDVTSGAIEADELAKAGVDDMLDDLGEIVLRAGGQLVVVPAEQMPTSTGVAAIYRY
jgi:Bacterial archaeo-eukaryotic release factor family 3